MIDELLDETRFLNLSAQRQSETIRRHCEGIIDRIRRAPDAHQALQVVQTACDNFELVCPSQIVRTSLRDHLTRVYDETWTRTPS